MLIRPRLQIKGKDGKRILGSEINILTRLCATYPHCVMSYKELAYCIGTDQKNILRACNKMKENGWIDWISDWEGKEKQAMLTKASKKFTFDLHVVFGLEKDEPLPFEQHEITAEVLLLAFQVSERWFKSPAHFEKEHEALLAKGLTFAVTYDR